MMKKLNDKKGITLTELLVSILILGMLGSAITVGIATGIKVYKESMEFSESNYLATIIVQKISDEIRSSENFSNDATPTFDSEGYGDAVSFALDANGQVTLGGKIILSDALYVGGVSVKDLIIENKPSEQMIKLSFKIVDMANSLEVEIGESYEYHIGYLN